MSGYLYDFVVVALFLDFVDLTSPAIRSGCYIVHRNFASLPQNLLLW